MIRRTRQSILRHFVLLHYLIIFTFLSWQHIAVCFGFPLIQFLHPLLLNNQRTTGRCSSVIGNDARMRKRNIACVMKTSELKDTVSGMNYNQREDPLRADSISSIDSSSSRSVGRIPVDDVVGSSSSSSSSSTIIIPTKIPTIWSSRHELFRMIRPNNIPGIILFHMLGVYLVMVHAITSPTAAATIATSWSTPLLVSPPPPTYWTILLKEPVIWLTLLSTNLVSATSMVVNDYYDAKLGRDTLKQHNLQQQQQKLSGGSSSDDDIDYGTTGAATTTDTKWILHPINGLWNKLVTRRLLMYLYSMALCISNCLPGIPTRISVNIALMMTYLYTVHLKPMTFIKNIVCAVLIALAPWTSGSCTLYLLQQNYNINIGSNSLLSGVWVIPSLWRLFGILFTGVMGREILMDCNDIVADRASGIRTIPVVYGCTIASYVAAFTTGIMTYLAISSPLQQLLQLLSNSADVAMPIYWRTAPFRRLTLAGVGCMIQLNDLRKIVQTNGLDRVAIEKMIEQNLYTVVLLMASFI